MTELRHLKDQDFTQ